MNQSKKLVFFGNERLSSGYDASGAPLLTSLIQAGYNVVAVVANFQPGRSRKERTLEVADVAQKYNIPVLLPRHPRDISDQLRHFKAQAGILAAYGKIVPQETIDIFPHGIINIHPSLLPLYRGPIPIEQAILDGAPRTGVSIMKLTKKMDAGPIYVQAALPLNGQETKAMLTKQLLHVGIKLLQQHLPAILAGTLTPESQNEANATYCQLMKKEDGIINWQKPAVQIEREIRAYVGWPGSRAELFNQQVVILEADVTMASLKPGEITHTTEAIVVGCGQNALRITKLRPSGRSSMQVSDFLRGLRVSTT